MNSSEALYSSLNNDQLWHLLKDRTRGLEKESLRIDSNGLLAQSSHPQALGSALCNPAITTDFSESLLEFITQPHSSIDAAMTELDNIHRFTYANIGEERLWVGSMPCILVDEASIPVAQYGVSNVAKMKTAYRVGLANRYGKAMQTIAGIHFNFSLSDEFFAAWLTSLGEDKSLQDFKTERYFSLIRNFHRYSWLLLYLLGASPAVCKSFLQGRPHQLRELENGTLVGDYATALRMGDLGYTSSAQEDLFVCYNHLDSYVKTLLEGLTAPYDKFQRIGVKDAAGNYQQLSDSILQIENEYYSTIRPKRTTHSGETPVNALLNRGVEYIEVRCLDLNPFLPLGVEQQDLQFVEAFLLYCLLAGDDALDCQGYTECKTNIQTVVNRGREPGVTLLNGGSEQSLQDWANTILDDMSEITSQLQDGDTQSLIESYRNRITQPELTPSGRIYDLLKDGTKGFATVGMEFSDKTAAYFKQSPLPADAFEYYRSSAKQSLVKQAETEATDSISFEEYLGAYFAQYDEITL